MRKKKSDMIASLFLYKYPALVESVYKRAKKYNSTLELLNRGEDGINILEVYPPEEFETERLTTNKEILNRDYDLGIKAGNSLINDWNRLVNKC